VRARRRPAQRTKRAHVLVDAAAAELMRMSSITDAVLSAGAL
jgi:hypothetical protein